ncbi:MAG TPA: hypothetical protein VF432_12890 [Thermoanaerobaculia bacterium]
MRTLFVTALFLTTTLSAQQTFDLTGYVAARGVDATGPASWLEGGFGRLEAGGDRDDFTALAHLGIDWHPTNWLDLHASGVARRDPEDFGGDDAGLVEAYADLRKELRFDELRLRGGFFFLPTSKENKDDNWASPYTIHFSALNTWIGEEVRPLGLDLQYRRTTNAGHTITGGVTAFRGNDTMGTLLGWRGWSVGDRLSTYGEVLPLPPLGSLESTGPFWRQQDGGTTPFTEDLDGHTGYSARIRYGIPQRGNIQYTYLDNAGDRTLYPTPTTESGEYSWETRFHLLGLELGNPDGFAVAAEYLLGDTYMGLAQNPSFVQAGFWATYLLVSEKRGRNRWTARYELFATTEEDQTILGEDNDESGKSWTLAWLIDVTPAIRAGAEFTQISGNREAAQQYGFDPSTTGRSFTAEVRYRF